MSNLEISLILLGAAIGKFYGSPVVGAGLCALLAIVVTWKPQQTMEVYFRAVKQSAVFGFIVCSADLPSLTVFLVARVHLVNRYETCRLVNNRVMEWLRPILD